jgi:hypothetical protein
MTDSGVGRLLVASLHQSIADVLPERLEFYEEWLSPSGLRDGRIGLAPMAAVLSFLRQEGRHYDDVAAQAGVYTADWSLQALSPFRRRLIMMAPRALRLRLVMRLANRVIRSAYGGSRAVLKTRDGTRVVDIRGSIFCGVREPVARPLCGFYAAVLSQLMRSFALDLSVATQACRATGSGPCLLSVAGRATGDTS